MNLQNFTPEYPATLTEQITRYLTKAIINNRFESGERLVEHELKRQFGVSRGPIREALRLLEKNGLVFNVPRKGTFVRKISLRDVEENFVVRANLESLAGRLAVEHLKKGDINKLRSALLKMEEAAGKNDSELYMNYHNQFHEIFIRASKNDTLIEILTNLRHLLAWLRTHRQDYAILIHKEILDLFIKKDSGRIEAVVKEHILVALDRFLQSHISEDTDKMESGLTI